MSSSSQLHQIGILPLTLRTLGELLQARSDVRRYARISVVTRDDDIWPTIERALFSDDFREQVVSENQRFFNDNVPQGGDPLKLMVDALEQIIQPATEPPPIELA